MKNSLFILAVSVASVSAIPMAARAVVTEVLTQVVTVGGNGYPGKAEATLAPSQSNSWRWGGWRHSHSRKTTVIVTSYPFPSIPAETPVGTPVVTATLEATKETLKPSSAQKPVYSSQAPSAVASSAPAAAPTDLKGVALYHHNVHRANHSSPDMVWDDQLADLAAQWAKNCQMSHSMDMGGVNYGQNLANIGDTRPIEQVMSPEQYMASSVSDQWYNGEFASYGDSWGKEGSGAGHLTQMVWAGSTKLGCAVQKCTTGGMNGYMTVCNYLPRGNVAGGYSKNVGVPKGEAIVTGNSKSTSGSYQ